MAKYLDSNGVLYLWNKIVSAFVKQEAGKGLSTNDFTTEEKNKLAGIAENANNYTLPQASAETLGGVKVGYGLEITGEGKLNVTGAGTADAVEWENVQSKPTTLEGYGITDAYTKSEVDSSLSAKANSADVYSKTDIDGKGYLTASDVEGKADKATTLAGYGITDAYTKSEVDGSLSTKANSADVYSKTEIDGKGYLTASDIENKADKATTLAGYGITDAYTKSEVDGSLSAKADKATTLAGYGITDAYTKTEINSKLSSVYKAAGEITFDRLPSPSEANLGYVYNVKDAFTTDERFLDEEPREYPVGTNVVVVLATNDMLETVYLYDVLSGFVDLSNYLEVTDVQPITNEEIDALTAS